jgi:hypothetical protein
LGAARRRVGGGGAGRRLGCGQVEARSGRVGDRGGGVVLRFAVAGGVVGGGSLDRDERPAPPQVRVAQCGQAALVMRERRGEHLLAVGVLGERVVLLAGPIDVRVALHDVRSSLACAARRPDPAVPLRVLVDGSATGLRLACGTSPRREEQVSRWPAAGPATQALTRRRSRHPEGSMTLRLAGPTGPALQGCFSRTSFVIATKDGHDSASRTTRSASHPVAVNSVLTELAAW